MNKIRSILICYLLSIILISAYVPWKFERHSTFRTLSRFEGYSFVLSPPNKTYIIDFAIIGLEFVIITCIFLIIFIMANKTNKTNSPLLSHPSKKEQRSFVFTPNMPDLTSGMEIQVFKDKDYFLIFKSNVVSIGETQLKNDLPLKFSFVMFAIRIESREPDLIVCQEYGFTDKTYLCFFDKAGSHINLGEIDNESSIDYFIEAALNLAKENLKINMSDLKSVS